MEPEISVVMPMYNVEAYLREAVDSLLGQSFENFELIVVDDASTDRSWDVLRTYADPRLVCLRNVENIGNYPSRNEGMRVAKGKYIPETFSDYVLIFSSRFKEQQHIPYFFPIREDQLNACRPLYHQRIAIDTDYPILLHQVAMLC